MRFFKIILWQVIFFLPAAHNASAWVGVHSWGNGKAPLTPVQEAVQKNDLETLKQFLKKQKVRDFFRSQSDQKLLNEALVEAGKLDYRLLIDYLLSRNASLFAADTRGFTALEYAIWNGNTELVKRAFEKNPDLLKLPHKSYRQTPLCIAARGRNLELMQWMIAKGAKVNELQYPSTSPLMCALDMDWEDLGKTKPIDPQLVQFLLDAGADLHQPNSVGKTPWMRIAGLESPELLSYVLAKGIPPPPQKKAALDAAVEENRPENVRKLCQSGCPLQHSNILTKIVSNTSLELVDVLLQTGADINPHATSVARAGM